MPSKTLLALFLVFTLHEIVSSPAQAQAASANPAQNSTPRADDKAPPSTAKPADAAVALEDAVKAMPDSSSLEMALGGAYLKSGAADKGVPHILKAVKLGTDGKGNEAQLLNDAAFMLAENHTHLDVAKEWAEKAVSRLDELSLAAADSDTASVSMSAELTAAWDTLGWVYFQLGDDARAESFLHAAWVMGQQRVVGDHLGQLYEKVGKKKMAERMYVQALSAPNDMTTFGSGPAATSSASYEKDRHQILAHYERLTGRKTPPLVAIERLPNGEWTKTPSDELQEAREVKLTKTTTLAGVAGFSIVFAPGHVDAVRFMTGDQELKSMQDKLEAAHYPMEFPAGSAAKIVRRGKLTCHHNIGCSVELLPPGQVAMRMY